MGGFWAGSIPPWAYATGAVLYIIAVLTGAWFGYGRGWAECEEDQGWAREQAKARRTHPVYHQPTERTVIPVEYRPAPVPGLGTAIWARSPEVAHEAWLAHEEQALAIANDFGGEGSPQRAGEPVLQLLSPPDLRPDLSDSQWMAYKLGELDQYMAGLLGTHPVTEEL